MTTYITITDPETDPDAPLTSELAKKWRDNAIAIGEGDSTAPVNAACWHPYNKVTASDSNDGKFYDFAIDGLVANRETPTFVDGWEYRIRMVGISHNSGASQDFRLELFRETTAAYGNIGVMVAAAAAATAFNAVIEIPTARLAVHSHYGVASISNNPGSTNNLNFGAPNFFSQSLVTAQKIGKARISFAAGSIDAGQMFLDKRRVYF